MKVGSMSRANRILLVTTVLLMAATSAPAGLFGSRKAKAAETAASSSMTLSAIELDGSSVVLRTSGTPAYTSYSPSPDVFVVDLTGTTRPAGVTVPTPLPASVTSIAAEEVTEMGSRLTRVTFRLVQSASLQASARDNAVVVNLPAAIAEVPAPAPGEIVVPAPEPVQMQPEPAVVEAPLTPEPPAPAPIPLEKAKAAE